MSDEEVLYQSPMLYRMIREGSGGLVIEVVVGGFAMTTVRVRLDAAESDAYAREGRAYSDRLAKAITARPAYDGRAYEVPE
ncbi:MAG: hypothetical protein R3B09_06310 [Nannocystaceae bacterium]